MILQVLADMRCVDPAADARRLKLLSRSDARQQQELGRAYRARAQDPSAAGSLSTSIATRGIVLVACAAAATATGPRPRITATLALTSSAASAGSRSGTSPVSFCTSSTGQPSPALTPEE